jgi:hypothetical protein
MAEDPSVLGNLPRSRPGRRSEKRDGAKKAAATARPAAAKASRSSASKPRAGAAPRGAKAQRATAASKPRPRAAGASRPAPQSRPASADPVTGAIRLAGQVAGAGLKVAGEVLKRLPGR